jgi:hypothetical protein
LLVLAFALLIVTWCDVGEKILQFTDACFTRLQKFFRYLLNSLKTLLIQPWQRMSLTSASMTDFPFNL